LLQAPDEKVRELSNDEKMGRIGHGLTWCDNKERRLPAVNAVPVRI